jgi:ABC-type lipoprotein release transport system permease subunit
MLLGLLYEVRPADPPTLAAVAVVVLVVSAGACTWPAARAARLAPIDALRHE